jgi:adenine/guanine phosphoribosyltransferase-like PRPP-binding protein
VDDIIATWGTMEAAMKIIKAMKCEVVWCVSLITISDVFKNNTSYSKTFENGKYTASLVHYTFDELKKYSEECFSY